MIFFLINMRLNRTQNKKGRQGSMKRYSVSKGRLVNELYSKRDDHIRYQYLGRTDNAEQYIAENSGKYRYGFQIKDSQTGKIIYKE